MLRKPITSVITAKTLLLLLDGCKTSVELAWDLGLFPSEISKYLHYYRQKGIIERSNSSWCLTNAGRKYIQEHLNYLNKLILHSRFEIKNQDDSRKLNLHSILEISKKWLGEDTQCMFIVEFLAFLYVERGKTYFEAGPHGLVDSLAEAIEEYSGSSYVSPFRIQECLAVLSQKGIVYIWRGRKIRLHKTLIEHVQKQSHAFASTSQQSSYPSRLT